LLLLECFKDSVADRATPQKIPSMITLFVAHSLTILLHPESALYPHINRYILSSPNLTLEEIPLFYTTMFSSNSVRESARAEVEWILNLIRFGLKGGMDYKMCQRRHVVDILLGFLASPLSDTANRVAILEVCKLFLTIDSR
jgi:hypothetical protein